MGSKKKCKKVRSTRKCKESDLDLFREYDQQQELFNRMMEQIRKEDDEKNESEERAE